MPRDRNHPEACVAGPAAPRGCEVGGPTAVGNRSRVRPVYPHGTGSPAVMLITLGCLLVTMLQGCSGLDQRVAQLTGPRQPGAELTLASLVGPHRLSTEFDHAVYSYETASKVTIVLTSGPVEQPDEVAIIRMMWRPAAGRTPMTRGATNATVHYIVFAGEDEAGVYHGAGFLFPLANAGDRLFRASLRQMRLGLHDASEHFADPLGRSDLTGDIVAKLDESAVRRQLRKVSQHLEPRLGYPRLVQAAPAAIAREASAPDVAATVGRAPSSR